MPLAGVTRILMLVPPFDISGSGKFGSPCERMHAENFSVCAPGVLDPEAADVPVPPVVVLVFEPRCATPEPAEVLPQPARSSAPATNSAAMAPPGRDGAFWPIRLMSHRAGSVGSATGRPAQLP